MKKKRANGKPREPRTRCVILNPTGEDDLKEMTSKLRELDHGRSFRIRLALDIAARLSEAELARAAGHYMQREFESRK